jgi:hypothetical protein
MKTNTQKREKEIRHSSSLVVLVHLNKLKLIGYVDSKGLKEEEEGVQVEREGNLILIHVRLPSCKLFDFTLSRAVIFRQDLHV